MSLLAGVNYDPAAAVAKSTATLLAMTAFDTTNLRLSFTVPTNGTVLVRLRCQASDQNQQPSILLGILQGASVIARQSPIGGLSGTSVSTTRATQEALFTVTGLTPGANLTWDAAYAVQVVLTGTNIRYGGPNDTVAANAWGGFSFEIYDAPNILFSKLYDPGTAGSLATTSNLAMTAMDTTNLRSTFTAPASGNVMVRIRGPVVGAATWPQLLFGVLSGASVIGRGLPIGAPRTAAGATLMMPIESEFIVTGLSGSQTWDAAYGVETLVASSALKYGGPNDALGADAWGGLLFEGWAL